MLFFLIAKLFSFSGISGSSSFSSRVSGSSNFSFAFSYNNFLSYNCRISSSRVSSFSVSITFTASEEAHRKSSNSK